jgi:hypothetical protein
LQMIKIKPTWFLFCSFETGSWYTAGAGLELAILLSQCWDYSSMPPHTAQCDWLLSCFLWCLNTFLRWAGRLRVCSSWTQAGKPLYGTLAKTQEFSHGVRSQQWTVSNPCRCVPRSSHAVLNQPWGKAQLSSDPASAYFCLSCLPYMSVLAHFLLL